MSDLNGIITDVIEREGPPSNDKDDKGGRTAFGISERSHPSAWADGKVTEDEAREIYLQKYVKGPGFDRVPEPLRSQLVDWGVNSGPLLAIMELQRVLGVTADGIIGPQTLGAIEAASASLNNQLVASRVRMIGRIVKRDPTQLKWINGWLNRALEFLV